MSRVVVEVRRSFECSGALLNLVSFLFAIAEDSHWVLPMLSNFELFRGSCL